MKGYAVRVIYVESITDNSFIVYAIQRQMAYNKYLNMGAMECTD